MTPPGQPTPEQPPPDPDGRSGRDRSDELYPNRAGETSLAVSVTAYLLSGPLLFGGGGWLLDRWLGTGFLTVVGVLVGMAMSIYVIWLRYGTH